MGKRVDRIAELEYTIEALEDEIDDLESRVIELITENDRLTLTYEPYTPEYDEDHGLTFYGLKEDNDSLTKQVHALRGLLGQQDQELYELRKTGAPSKPKYFGALSLDFWPLREWFRLSLHRWSPGRTCHLCIGPIRFEFSEE